MRSALRIGSDLFCQEQAHFLRKKKKNKVARSESVWICPNSPYLWTLRFRIHIIFMCHEIFDFFPTRKKNVKSPRKTGSDLPSVGLTGLQSKLHVCPSSLAPAESSQS